MLKFEGLFEVGQKIRAYDYDPVYTGDDPMYLEGEVLGIDKVPYLSYRVKVDTCTGYGRQGKEIFVPMEISSHEFDGRIIGI
jgi:hypothetical protein